MDVLIPAAIGLLVVAVAAARSVVVVPRDHACVVERLGRYARTLPAGMHVVVPLVEAVRRRHTLAEVGLPIGALTCITLDNRPVTLEGALRIAVRDPQAATYQVADHADACIEAVRTALRDEVAGHPLDHVLTARSSLARDAGARTARVAAGWGVDVRGCEIGDIAHAG